MNKCEIIEKQKIKDISEIKIDKRKLVSNSSK